MKTFSGNILQPALWLFFTVSGLISDYMKNLKGSSRRLQVKLDRGQRIDRLRIRNTKTQSRSIAWITEWGLGTLNEP